MAELTGKHSRWSEGGKEGAQPLDLSQVEGAPVHSPQLLHRHPAIACWTAQNSCTCCCIRTCSLAQLGGPLHRACFCAGRKGYVARSAENGDRACYVQRGGDGPKKDLNLRVGGLCGTGWVDTTAGVLGRAGCCLPQPGGGWCSPHIGIQQGAQSLLNMSWSTQWNA